MSADCRLPDAYRLLHLAETGSTNTVAMERARQGEPGGLWVLADRQSAGRGRSGRSWQSVAGNLYASLLLRPQCPPAAIPQLSLLAGVAVIEAIGVVAGLDGGADPQGLNPSRIRLKWPNDIMVEGAKCGGILVESSNGLGASGPVAVIGVGLNLAGYPGDLGRSATSLAECGIVVTSGAMLSAVASAIDRWLAIWDDGREFSRVRDGWSLYGCRVGDGLTVNTGTGTVSGHFAGLDQDGALLLSIDDGPARRFTFGDVTAAGDPPAGQKKA